MAWFVSGFSSLQLFSCLVIAAVVWIPSLASAGFYDGQETARSEKLEGNFSCQCKDASHCNRIEAGPRQEVMGWSTHPGMWHRYDWEKLTTVVVFRDWDDDAVKLMCFAHSKHVRVVLAGFFDVANLSKPEVVSAWIEDQVTLAETYHADGINIDIEQPILNGSKDNELLVSLVKRTRAAFRERFGHAQVSFDVAWSTECVDNRCYDAKGLADNTDFLVLMSYDEQGQIFHPPCLAGANSGLIQTIHGISTYLKLNISSHQLILGMPWYGYDYTCVPPPQNDQAVGNEVSVVEQGYDLCYIKHVPYQGANCSDAAGKQEEYWWIMKTLYENSTHGSHWDNRSMSPYYEYVDDHGVRHQVWYDSPDSLEIKYKLVKDFKLAGLSFWGLDFLDYYGKAQGDLGIAQANVMWDVVDARL